MVTALVILLTASLVAPSGSLASDPTDTTVRGIDVDATTIPQLQQLMNDGDLKATQLTRFYLERIDQLNPLLNAVITVNPHAIREARAADRARRHGDDRPLLGIPIIVKDNINTTGMPTTAGSWALAGSTPSDAFIVEQLKAAGAIILGKANLSEWANFRSIPSSSGWSGIGGQTNMAHVLDRNPCGSSSGSGVVVAADLAVAAVGTETDGSVVCPAGANGIVGIKPTVGLLSREGIIPISADQDTAGPMTRNVTDAAVLLGAMTGIDRADRATRAQRGHAFTDYTQFLDDEALQGAVIGFWQEGTYDPAVSPEVDAVMQDTIAALEAQGATVVEVSVPLTDEIYTAEFDALLCEFKTDIRRYLRTYAGRGYPEGLRDLIRFNEAHPDLEGPWNSEIFVLADATDGRNSTACRDARAAATPPTQQILDDLLADFDAIIGPTNGPAWVTDPVNGDLGGDFSTFVGSSSASAISGYATVTVPAGYAQDVLPIGVTFIGGQWDEPDLIAMAYDFEQATQVRVPPQFLDTLD
jgi:amidase